MFSNGVFIFVVGMFSFSFVALSQTAVNPTAANSVTSVNTESPSSDGDVFYLCRRGTATRWLRAYKLENGKCKALYSKEGYLQVISSATFFASCEGVLLNVKKNLEEGNFKCSQMTQASVIELESN